MIESKLFSLAKEKYDKKKVEQNLKESEQNALIGKLGDKFNKKEGDISLIKKAIPEKIPYIRSSRFENDFGNVKTKCMINVSLNVNERFSYLSFLYEYRGVLESFTRISSKAIKVNSIQILIPKISVGGDSYYIHKYCPRSENVSCSSETNLDPRDVEWDGSPPESTEYSNLAFLTNSSVDKKSRYHYFDVEGKELNQMENFYINSTNPYMDDMDPEFKLDNVTNITKATNKDNVGDQFIRLNLSSTDNDILIMVFVGKTIERIQQGLTVKVIFDIEFTVEDYIQNTLSHSGNVSPIILREILMKRSEKILKNYWLFAISVKNDNAKALFKSALDVFDANKNIITMFNRYKSIYKSCLSLASKGTTSSSSKKLYDLIFSEKLYRKPKKKNFITEASGIYAVITQGINFSKFNDMNTNIKNYKNLGSFISDFLKTGTLQLYLGDDRTIPNTLVERLVELPTLLKEEDPEKVFLRNKRLLDQNAIKTSLIDKMKLYNVFEGKYKNVDIRESEEKAFERIRKERAERIELLNIQREKIINGALALNAQIEEANKVIEENRKLMSEINDNITKKEEVIKNLQKIGLDQSVHIKAIQDYKNQQESIKNIESEKEKEIVVFSNNLNGAKKEIELIDKQIIELEKEREKEMDIS